MDEVSGCWVPVCNCDDGNQRRWHITRRVHQEHWLLLLCAVQYLVVDTYILYTTALCYRLLYSILISYIFMLNTITINRMWSFFLYVSLSNKSMREENVRSRDNVSGRADNFVCLIL